MKKLKPLILLVIFVLILNTWGPVAAAGIEQSSSAEPTVKLVVNNKTGSTVYLNLKGPQTYYLTINPGKNKVDVVKGKYTFTYRACDKDKSGNVNVRKANMKMTLESCGQGTKGKVKIVKLTVINNTGSNLYLNMYGPANYYLTVRPGTSQLQLQKGTYTYTATASCGSKSGSIKVRPRYKWRWWCY